MKTFINYLNESKIESEMITDKDGNEYWVIPNTERSQLSHCNLGILHREDGPAVEQKDGCKAWFIKGLRHREDGPAIEWNNGAISWYLKYRSIKPTNEMMEKYIRLNPENIFKNWDWPKEIQVLAIELGGDEIRDRLIKEKKIHPSLIVKGLDKLDNRGFFN